MLLSSGVKNRLSAPYSLWLLAHRAAAKEMCTGEQSEYAKQQHKERRQAYATRPPKAPAAGLPLQVPGAPVVSSKQA
jgi:hypothetical protein